MRKFFLILAVSFSLIIKAQTTQWVKTAGGINSEKGITIGVDSLGFVYIGGFYNGDANFGPFAVTSAAANSKEIFVAKMDTNGNFIWVATGGGPWDDRLLGMHVDPAGNVYCTGTFWGPTGANFGSIIISGDGNDQSFIAKLDANGNWLWAKAYGAPASMVFLSANLFFPVGDDHGYDIKADDLGNIYVTGFWSGQDAFFDGFSLTNPTGTTDTISMGYIAKLDPTGNFLWVQKFDGIDDRRGERDNRMAIDKDYNVYITGGFKNTGIYGSHTIVSRGDWDVFVTKLDADGNFLCARRAGSDKGDRGNGIAIADDGDIYIDGEFREDADFGNELLNHKSRKDIFVAKLKPNGDWMWASRAKKSAGKDRPNQMSVDKDEYVFICGEIGDTTQFGDTIINNLYNDQNIFVAELNVNGDWLWAKSGGGPTVNDRANDIVVDKWGNNYIVGYYEGTANFDGHTVTAQGKKDIFIWKIDKFIDPNPPVEEEPLVILPPPKKGVHVPDAFSPNDDGNNDILLVYGGQISDIYFAIYQRGGKLIFNSNNQSVGWDGNINGIKAMSGVYIYSVKVIYKDGQIETKIGDITLVR